MIDTQQIADRLKNAESAHRLPEQIASKLLAAQTQGELVSVPVLKTAIVEVRGDIKDLELRLNNSLKELESKLAKEIRNVWRPIALLAVITWIVQVFGNSIRLLLHLP